MKTCCDNIWVGEDEAVEEEAVEANLKWDVVGGVCGEKGGSRAYNLVFLRLDRDVMKVAEG
jgi:hypothetical protein